MFNHKELEIHRSSLKLMKIWKDSMSFNGAQLYSCQTWQVLRSYWLVCVRGRSLAKGELWHLCDTWLLLFPLPFRWAWQFTAASWKSTLRSSVSTSRAVLRIWWTRPMSGSSRRTATMTLTQSPKTKNKRRSWKRNNSEHVSTSFWFKKKKKTVFVNVTVLTPFII